MINHQPEMITLTIVIQTLAAMTQKNNLYSTREFNTKSKLKNKISKKMKYWDLAVMYTTSLFVLTWKDVYHLKEKFSASSNVS